MSMKLAELDARLSNFEVLCDCTQFPLRMNFLKIAEPMFGGRQGLYMCGKCQKRKRVVYVGGNKGFVIKDGKPGFLA